jgi:DNA-binding HxlR family transcriptional regulator
MRPAEKKIWEALWGEIGKELSYTELAVSTGLSPRGLSVTLKSLVDRMLISHHPVTKKYRIPDTAHIIDTLIQGLPENLRGDYTIDNFYLIPWEEYNKIMDSKKREQAKKQIFKYESAYNYVFGRFLSYLTNDEYRLDELRKMLHQSLNHLELWSETMLGLMLGAVQDWKKLNDLTKREYKNGQIVSPSDEDLFKSIYESIENCKKTINEHVKETFIPMIESTLTYMFENWDLVEELDNEYKKTIK